MTSYCYVFVRFPDEPEAQDPRHKFGKYTDETVMRAAIAAFLEHNYPDKWEYKDGHYWIEGWRAGNPFPVYIQRHNRADGVPDAYAAKFGPEDTSKFPKRPA
jgi:hypothetical protein